MSFNYVLQRQQIYSQEKPIVGLYVTRKNAINRIHRSLTTTWANLDQAVFDQKILMVDNYFKGKSDYVLTYKDRNGKLKAETVEWSELTVAGMSLDEYIKQARARVELASKRKVEAQESNNQVIAKVLKDQPLPASRYVDKYCWCLIDLQEYQEMLSTDVDEIMNAGEYAEYAETIFRDNQFDTLDSVQHFNQDYALLLGKTGIYEDKYGSLGKGINAIGYSPFRSENKLYSLTKEGINHLSDDLKDVNDISIKLLANWCTEVIDKLPNKASDSQSVALVDEATPRLSFTVSKNDKLDDKADLYNMIHNLHKGVVSMFIKEITNEVPTTRCSSLVEKEK